MKIILNDEAVLSLLEDLTYIKERECDTIYGQNFYRGMIRMMKNIVGWDYDIVYLEDKGTHELSIVKED